MLIMSYMGDHVWLMTSRQTDPDLRFQASVIPFPTPSGLLPRPDRFPGVPHPPSCP